MNSPFSSLKSSLDSEFPKGTVVMFDLEGAPVTGIINGLKKDRYQINFLNAQNIQNIELTKNRLHKVPGALVEEAKDHFLEALKKITQNTSDKIDLESIWQKILTENKNSSFDLFQKPFHPAEITKMIFGEVTTENYITVRRNLILDKIYFKRDDKGFLVRKESEVLNKQQEETNREKRINNYQKVALFLKNCAKDKNNIQIPEDLEHYINQLKMCAALAEYPEESWHTEIEELVHYLEHNQPGYEGRIEHRAFHILYKAGIVKKDTNLSFIRHNPRINFDEKILASADKLSDFSEIAEIPDIEIRTDFTWQNCFTIDDSSTKDMDDAIFLENTDTGGFNLYIHISDLSAIIPKDSLLDIEAKLRATSIYTPELEVPMFPPQVSHNLGSLVVGKLKAAITVIFEVDSDFQITSADIQPSVIKVANRYSYDEVDQFLRENIEPFCSLSGIASLHEQKRIDDGAVPVIKRDAQPVLLEKNDIAIIDVDEQSPARALIGEMMVLYNIVAANFLFANDLPALYRSQEKPDFDSTLVDIPDGAARQYAERGKLKRSSVELTPKYHATLGTQKYVQSTSPIRRYLDLVLQRQIMSFFREENSAYSEKQLLSLLNNLEEPLQKASAISKESKRFWMLRYLEKYYTDNRSIFGTVVRTDTKFPIVELNALYINVPAKISKPQLGARYELKIERVDPRSDFVRLEEVRRK